MNPVSSTHPTLLPAGTTMGYVGAAALVANRQVDSHNSVGHKQKNQRVSGEQRQGRGGSYMPPQLAPLGLSHAEKIEVHHRFHKLQHQVQETLKRAKSLDTSNGWVDCEKAIETLSKHGGNVAAFANTMTGSKNQNMTVYSLVAFMELRYKFGEYTSEDVNSLINSLNELDSVLEEQQNQAAQAAQKAAQQAGGKQGFWNGVLDAVVAIACVALTIVSCGGFTAAAAIIMTLAVTATMAWSAATKDLNPMDMLNKFVTVLGVLDLAGMATKFAMKQSAEIAEKGLAKWAQDGGKAMSEQATTALASAKNTVLSLGKLLNDVKNGKITMATFEKQAAKAIDAMASSFTDLSENLKEAAASVHNQAKALWRQDSLALLGGQWGKMIGRSAAKQNDTTAAIDASRSLDNSLAKTEADGRTTMNEALKVKQAAAAGDMAAAEEALSRFDQSLTNLETSWQHTQKAMQDAFAKLFKTKAQEGEKLAASKPETETPSNPDEPVSEEKSDSEKESDEAEKQWADKLANMMFCINMVQLPIGVINSYLGLENTLKMVQESKDEIKFKQIGMQIDVLNDNFDILNDMLQQSVKNHQSGVETLQAIMNNKNQAMSTLLG